MYIYALAIALQAIKTPGIVYTPPVVVFVTHLISLSRLPLYSPSNRLSTDRSVVVVLSVRVRSRLMSIDHPRSGNNSRILIIDTSITDSGGGLVARSHIRTSRSSGSSRDRSNEVQIPISANLLIMVTIDALVVHTLLLPELALALGAIAAGVVICGGRPVLLLLLVGAHEQELHESADEEEEGADDGDDEDGFVQAAGGAGGDGVGDVVVETGVCGASQGAGADVVAGAGVHGAAGQDGDGDEAAHAEDVD